MKHVLSDIKLSDVRQGVVALGLSEYTSRKCRLLLVRAIYEAMEESLNYDRTNGVLKDKRISATSLLASNLHVTKRTVQRWLSGGIQSCNINAEKLIMLAFERVPEYTKELLEEDLEIHRSLFNSMTLNDVRQGVVAPSQKVVA